MIGTRLLRNTMWSGTATVISGAVGFLILPYMVAKLGLVQLGVLGIINIFSMAGYISLFDMGLQGSIAKYTAEFAAHEQYDRIRSLVATMLIGFVVIGLILMLAGFALSEVLVRSLFKVPEQFEPTLMYGMALMFASYVFQFPNVVFLGMLEGLQRFDLLKFVQSSAAILHSLLTFVLLYLGYGVIALVALLLTLQFAQFLLFGLFAFRRLGRRAVFGKFSLQVVKEVGRMTRNLFYGKIAGLVFHYTDRVLIAIFLGPVAMGSYEVVVKFPRLMKAILGVVNSAIMPAASQLAALGREGTLQRLVRTGTTFHVVLAYPIVMGLMFFAGSFLQVWIGPEYKDLATLLRVAFAYNLVVALVGTGGSVLVGSDRFLGWNAGIGAASAVLNVGLTLVLMQYFGLLGVFAATTLSLTLALPAYYTLYKRTAGVSFAEVGGIVIRVLLAGIVPAIVMIGFTNIVPPTNVIGLVAALITWVALQWAVLYFMTLDRATRTEIRTVLRLAIPALA